MEPCVSANLVFGTVYSTILSILVCRDGGFMMPWWLTLIIALVPAVIAGAVTLHISRKSQLNKQADAMRSTEQKAKPEQRPSPEQQPSKEFAVLKEQLDAIQKDIGKTPDDKTLTGQNKDLKELLQKEIETAERRYTESDKRLRDFILAQHNTVKPVTLGEVAQAYLDICGKDCGGDDSTGVPSCQFYQRPDVDENGLPCSGTCQLKSYRYKSN